MTGDKAAAFRFTRATEHSRSCLIRRTASLPVLALMLGILCIACSAIFVKNAGVPGATSAFYRVTFALIGTLPLLAFRRLHRVPLPSAVVVGAGGAAFAIELVLWQMALLSTTAANATLLVNLAPLWVGLAGLIFLGERQSIRFWGGSALGFVGMSIVVMREAWGLRGIGDGDLLAAVSSFFYAAYLVVTRRQRAALDTVTFLALSSCAAVAVTFSACMLLGAPLSGFTAGQWSNLLALGFVSHLVGYLAINYALGHIPVTRVAVALLAQPVVTALLAAGFLHEPLTAPLILGGSVALAGLGIALLAPPRRDARVPTT